MFDEPKARFFWIAFSLVRIWRLEPQKHLTFKLVKHYERSLITLTDWTVSRYLTTRILQTSSDRFSPVNVYKGQDTLNDAAAQKRAIHLKIATTVNG